MSMRTVIDQAIREYVANGPEAYRKWSDARNANQAIRKFVERGEGDVESLHVTPESEVDALYAEANRGHSEFDCRAHSEDLNCCLDHEHERYGELVAFIADKLTGALTYDELEQACRNIGFDLTCGQCAAVFLTGAGTYRHDEWCSTLRRPDDDVVMTGGAGVWNSPDKRQVATEAVRAIGGCGKTNETHACLLPAGHDPPCGFEPESPVLLYSIEAEHLAALRSVAEQLHTRPLTGDDTRQASQTIMAVVRFAESLEAMRGPRGPGEPYVHMTPREKGDA